MDSDRILRVPYPVAADLICELCPTEQARPDSFPTVGFDSSVELELREEEILPAQRQRTSSTNIENNDGLKAEIKYLRRELQSLRRLVPAPQLQPPSPVPCTVHASFKLSEITETIPKFDGHNISVSQFARSCRRALDSLPVDYSIETETLLTRLLISKLSGHAYVVVEN
ncbi:hypothetical protein M0802_016014 [Mischocyttarus mexicanus]|nr:hypothetical protein M0802_016014 [Mischocyttarus mexicanus]